MKSIQIQIKLNLVAEGCIIDNGKCVKNNFSCVSRFSTVPKTAAAYNASIILYCINSDLIKEEAISHVDNTTVCHLLLHSQSRKNTPRRCHLNQRVRFIKETASLILEHANTLTCRAEGTSDDQHNTSAADQGK